MEEKKRYTSAQIMKFLIPSIIGIVLFMVPVPKFNAELNVNETTIPVKILADLISNGIGSFIPTLVFIILMISSIGTLIFSFGLVKTNNKNINKLFVTTPVWAITRILAGVFAVMVFFSIGPEQIISGDTGTFIFNDLLTTLVIIFVIAGLLLPLLLDFGLLEYVGTLLTKFMRPVFTLPGRSAVDCFTSWLGDGTLGVMLTNNQYEEGYYTQREAAVIATTFSAVSITFCLVVLAQVGLTRLFLPYYLTVSFIGVVIAIIVPRIPPLSRKKDVYVREGIKLDESIPAGHSLSSYALECAVKRADKHEGAIAFVESGFMNAMQMWLGVLPVVMAFGTIATMLSTYTPIFEILGRPFIPLLKLLAIPEAEAASKTMLVGFTDMFLPAIIAAGEIKSELTLFIVAVVSVTQLLYMSEVGALILGSDIPVNLWELFVIFIQRTLISLVLVVLIGRFILGLA